MTSIFSKTPIFYYNKIMNFAENLREELKFQDMQIKQLAAKTGISKNTIDKYLSEKHVQPGVENAVKIAQVLGVTVEYLVNGEEETTLHLNNEYKTILHNYKMLNKFNKKTIADLLESLISRQKN